MWTTGDGIVSITEHGDSDAVRAMHKVYGFLERHPENTGNVLRKWIFDVLKGLRGSQY